MTTVAGKTDLVRMQLVLGEDVAVRDTLQVRVTTASGAAIVDGSVVVTELGEHGWPVVLLDRRLVPPGRLTVRVVSPHRVESQFTLDLK